MITLTLLHPVQSTPVQSWTFDNESVIRIGRAVDNHVVLYSAVVSRYHVELRRTGSQWEVANLGTNGTYLDGKRINQSVLEDGGMLRLARSGPNLQVRVGREPGFIPPVAVATSVPSDSPDLLAAKATEVNELPESEEHSENEPGSDDDDEPESPGLSFRQLLPYAETDSDLEFEQEHKLDQPTSWDTFYQVLGHCQHEHASPEDIFCIDCGQPLKVWKTLGCYQLLKPLGDGNHLFNTYLAWRSGYSLALKTLDPFWLDNSWIIEQFQQRIQQLSGLFHPGLPKVLEGANYQGYPVLVTEMIYGPTLRQWVSQQGVLNQSQAIAWMIQLCETLEYLHQQNPPIVHQNIKPSTLIRPMVPHTTHEIMLVNLGQMTLVTADTGTFTTAFGYTAPEQQAGHPIPASDLFAVGAVLVYLLTGQEPDSFYRWGNEEQEFRLFADDIEGLTPEVKAIIDCLTHPEPAARYPSAWALAENLRQLQKLHQLQ